MLATTTAQPGFSLLSFLPFILIFAIFYFLIIAPQRKRQRQLQEMVSNLKKGDRVVTNGGIHGRVVRADDGTVTLSVAQGVEVKFNKSSVAGLLESAE